MSEYKYKKAVIDFETTGFRNPGILQCSILLLDSENIIKGYYNRYFLNDRPIEQDAIDKSHGLTPSELKTLTDVYFKDKARDVHEILSNCEKIYAHNVEYDINQVFNPNIKAVGLPPIPKDRLVCTMTHYAKVCKLPSKNPKYPYKNPKLVEAVDYLDKIAKIDKIKTEKSFCEMFDVESASEHDSLYDCFLCMQLVKNM